MSAAVAVLAMATTAAAQQRNFDIPAESAVDSIPEFARQAGVQITAPDDQLAGVKTAAIKGPQDVRQALKSLLAGTGLHVISDSGSVIILHRGSDETGPQADGAATKVAEVVVTGSHLRGQPITPVTTITAKAIEAGGFFNTEQVIEDLPENFSGGASTTNQPLQPGLNGASVQNQAYAVGVNLYGLGTGATLVLVNGMRLAPTANGTVTDISTIPASIIDRVEVLADGASAIYGSDAIAGVVNIITKRDFDGAQTSVRYGSADDGSAARLQAGQLFGTNWAGGNLTVSYDYQQNSPLLASQRTFSSHALSPTDLELGQSTNSLYVSLTQVLQPNLSLQMDATASRRDFDGTENFQIYNLIQKGSATRYGGDIDLKYSASPKLSFYLDLGASKEDDTSFSNYVQFNQVYLAPAGYTTAFFEPRFAADLFSLPGGTVSVAGGVHLEYNEQQNANGNQGTPLTYSENNRQSAAAYAEVRVPIIGADNRLPGIYSLDLSVAGRYEHYSDFGDTANPKVAILWSPVQPLSIHASYSTSFRAPPLQFLEQQQGYAIIDAEPNRSGGGTTLSLIDEGDGNPNLKAEKSTNWNVGFTFQPANVPGLKISTSYYNVTYTNQVEDVLDYVNPYNLIPLNSALGSLYNGNPTLTQINGILNNSNYLVFNLTPSPYVSSDIKAIYSLGYNNVASTKVIGIDFDSSYTFHLGDFVLKSAFKFDYMLDDSQGITPTSPSTNYTNDAYYPLRFKGSASLNWSKAGLGGYIREYYDNPYKDTLDIACTGLANGCPVGATWTTDVGLSYSFDDHARPSLRGLRLGLDVQNLFDRNPPYVPNYQIGYDPTNGNPVGRFISVSAVKRW